MQSLSFEKRVRSGKATQHYVDFIVSGDSLLTSLNAEDKDLITTFGWCDHNVELDFIRQLTGVIPPELASGRVMIYACPECVDIACGCISAKIEFTDTKVIWKEFGYENGYEEIRFDSYKHLPQIEFDREKYMQLFSTISPDKSHL